VPDCTRGWKKSAPSGVRTLWLSSLSVREVMPHPLSSGSAPAGRCQLLMPRQCTPTVARKPDTERAFSGCMRGNLGVIVAKMTREGFAYLLRKYVRSAAQRCPSLTSNGQGRQPPLGLSLSGSNRANMQHVRYFLQSYRKARTPYKRCIPDFIRPRDDIS
jgi:hypothetical protein